MTVAVMNSPATVLPPDAVETDITGETDLVGNGEFLLAVFGDELADARPVVVSFEGNPVSVPAKGWFCRPWQGTPEVPASANNYFSLAVFRPDEAGQFRRQKARFHALYAVMLDDIGTKVALERLTLPSSWLLEATLPHPSFPPRASPRERPPKRPPRPLFVSK